MGTHVIPSHVTLLLHFHPEGLHAGDECPVGLGFPRAVRQIPGVDGVGPDQCACIRGLEQQPAQGLCKGGQLGGVVRANLCSEEAGCFWIGEHGPGFLVHDFAGTSAVRQITFNDHEGPRRRCCGVNVPVARTRAVDVNRPRGLGVHRRPSLTHRAWRHRPLRPSARPTRTCPQGACERSSRRRTGRCSSIRAHPQARR